MPRPTGNQRRRTVRTDSFKFGRANPGTEYRTDAGRDFGGSVTPTYGDIERETNEGFPTIEEGQTLAVQFNRTVLLDHDSINDIFPLTAALDGTQTIANLYRYASSRPVNDQNAFWGANVSMDVTITLPLGDAKATADLTLYSDGAVDTTP